MYKVFVNDNCLILSEKKVADAIQIPFEKENSFSEILTRLENETELLLNIYDSDLENLWEIFKAECKQISAAGGIVLNPKKEILFIKRLNKWDLPKGKVEKEENIEEAACREIAEECNVLDAEITHFLITTYHIYTLKNIRILKSTHWFLMHSENTDELIPQTEEGIEEVCWKATSELKEICQNTYKNIILVLDNYLHSEKV